MIDDTDRKIVAILQENGRMAAAEVARRVEMAPSAVFERIKKLEEKGVIRGYAAEVEPRAVCLGLLAFVFVKTEGPRPVGLEGRRGELIAAIPGVQEVHHVAGEDCYLVKVRARDTEDLGRTLRERFGAVPGVVSTRTTIVLETLKETTRLPVEGVEQEAEGARAAGTR